MDYSETQRKGLSSMLTNIHVNVLSKGGYYYLRTSYRQDCCDILFWEGTGIRTTQPRHLAEDLRRRKLESLYDESRQEEQCEQWSLETTPRRQPVSAWMNRWLEEHNSRVCERTATQYTRILHDAGEFLDQLVPDLRSITPSAIFAYSDHLKDLGLSSRTIRQRLAIVRAAFQTACNLGFLKVNPTNGIPLPCVQSVLPAPYTLEEQHHLYNVIQGSPLEIPVSLALVYGLRRGEVCGICWEDIDFERNVLHIRHNAVLTHDESGRCRTVCSNVMKTASSRRSFPLHPRIRILLLAHQAQTHHNSGPVLECRFGGPMRPSSLSRQFRRLLQENNLRPIRFHDLRHSCATELARNHCDLEEVQAYLGHSSLASTLIYVHPDEQSNRHTLSCMEQLLNSAV